MAVFIFGSSEQHDRVACLSNYKVGDKCHPNYKVESEELLPFSMNNQRLSEPGPTESLRLSQSLFLFISIQ